MSVVVWYVLRADHALVQATIDVGTVVIVYIGVAYTKGGGLLDTARSCAKSPPRPLGMQTALVLDDCLRSNQPAARLCFL